MSSTVTIDFKIADIKLKSSEAYLLKLEKNAVLNACGCLKGFYTYKKIKVKVRLFFIKDAKNHRNQLNRSFRNTGFKT